MVTAAPLLPAGKLLLMPLMGPLIAAPVDVGVPGPMQHTHTSIRNIESVCQLKQMGAE